MKLATWGTRERALAFVGLALLAAVGVFEVWEAVVIPERQRLAGEARRLERKLSELKTLRARSEEIRERFESIDRKSRDEPSEAVNTAEDLLRRLETAARGNVHLVKVHPEPPDRNRGTSQTKLSLEFLDDRRRLDHFLYGLVQNLGGDVQAFQASVSGQGAIRCQATVVFHHPAAPAPAEEGET